MEEAGVSPVLLYVLTPRLSDLGFLESLQDAGFQPKATALILNEGKVDPLGKGEAFARTMQHRRSGLQWIEAPSLSGCHG